MLIPEKHAGASLQPMHGVMPSLCRQSDNDRIIDISNAPVEREEPQGSEERYLLCIFCKNRITRSEQRVEINGSHQHLFTNPAGEHFRIGCFAAAAGCRMDGYATSAYTWFAGFSWRIAICSLCGMQLGWYYQAADGQNFFGLILNRLLEKI
jgi:hypothetical protein